MMGIMGAAAKVETKQVKNEAHERWNVRMWGFAKEKSFRALALCSESTGRSNLAASRSLASIVVMSIDDKSTTNTSTRTSFQSFEEKEGRLNAGKDERLGQYL